MSKLGTFEKEYEALEKATEKIKNGSYPLKESLELYEETIEHYKNCKKILEEAKQKVTLYDATLEEESVLK